MEFQHSYLRLIMLFTLSLLLSACSGTGTQDGAGSQPAIAPAVLSPINQPAQFYIDQVKLANKQQMISWQLLATRALISEGHSQPAMDILQEIERNQLSEQQKFEVSLIKSEAYLFEKRYQDAADTLLYESSLSVELQAHWQRFYLLKATFAERLGDNAKAVEYRVALNDYLDLPLQASNNHQLWQLLTPLPSAELNQLSLMYRPTNIILSGWYQLAAIGNEYSGDPQLLIGNLQAWKNNYPAHPALTVFPIELMKALATAPYAPGQVAVLVPLTGKRGTTGSAIRKGVLSAYYQEPLEQRLTLRFYDTASADAGALYLQAINEGADFVIGPLLKENLSKVLPLVEDIPLISLNKLPESPIAKDIYYFSLTSNDEAVAAAKKMQRDGIRHPLVLTPDNQVGSRLANVFSDQWQKLTAETSDIYQYKSRKDMQNTVTSLFSVNDSDQRINQIKNLIGQDIKAKTRSRRDIDAIYIIATPSEAMLAIPYIITTQNPYVDQVAVYASSRTHSDTQSKNQSRDLNGLIFSDMPWLLNPDRELKQETLGLWPNMSKIEQNLFAMGYDAVKLIPNLQQLRNFPSLRLNGQTGILYVNDAGVIEREFSWAKYRYGKIRLEETSTEKQSTP